MNAGWDAGPIEGSEASVLRGTDSDATHQIIRNRQGRAGEQGDDGSGGPGELVRAGRPATLSDVFAQSARVRATDS